MHYYRSDFAAEIPKMASDKFLSHGAGVQQRKVSYLAVCPQGPALNKTL